MAPGIGPDSAGTEARRVAAERSVLRESIMLLVTPDVTTYDDRLHAAVSPFIDRLVLQRSENSLEPAAFSASSTRVRKLSADGRASTDEVYRNVDAQAYLRYQWRTQGDPFNSLLPVLFGELLGLTGLEDAAPDLGATVTGIAVQVSKSGSREEVLDAVKVSYVWETETAPGLRDGLGMVRSGESALAPGAPERNRDESAPPLKISYGPDYSEDGAGMSKAVGGHAYLQFHEYKSLAIGPPNMLQSNSRPFRWQPTIGVEFGDLSRSESKFDEFAGRDPLTGRDRNLAKLLAGDREIDEGSFLRGIVAVDAAWRVSDRLTVRAAGEFRRLQSSTSDTANRWFVEYGASWALRGASAPEDRSAKYQLAQTNHYRTKVGEGGKSVRQDADWALTVTRRVGELPPNFGRVESWNVGIEAKF